MLNFIKRKNILVSLVIVFIIVLFFISKDNINKIAEYHENKISEEKIKSKSDYFAIIEIEKINLKKELYEVNNPKNNVDINIFVHKNSIFPNNIILASHSGNGRHAYFKNLFKLKKEDIIKIYNQGKVYKYIIEEIEEQNKTGKLYIKNSLDDRLILITCHKNNKSQVIYYSKLVSIKDI